MSDAVTSVEDGSCTEVKAEEHEVHFAVKCEEERLDFDDPVVVIKSEFHSENSCVETEGKKEDEIDSDWEAEHESSDDDAESPKEKRFKCDKCSYQTDNPWRFRRHNFSHNDEKSLDCPHCNYKGRRKSYLQLHLKHAHPDQFPHVCDVCPYRSLNLSSLEKHKKRHKQESMKCEFCNDFITTDLMQMKCHKRRVHMQKCSECDFGSISVDKLRKHMSMHETETTLVCVVCNYKTLLPDNLERHIAAKHVVENADYAKYKCLYCPFKSSLKIEYRVHVYQHTGERPFSCDQCNYKTTLRKYLRMHNLHMHSKDKPFKCEICEKSFVHNAYLQNHLNVHSKKKPFRCDECNFSTAYKSSLGLHKRGKHCKTFV